MMLVRAHCHKAMVSWEYCRDASLPHIWLRSCVAGPMLPCTLVTCVVTSLELVQDATFSALAHSCPAEVLLMSCSEWLELRALCVLTATCYRGSSFSKALQQRVLHPDGVCRTQTLGAACALGCLLGCSYWVFSVVQQGLRASGMHHMLA